MGTPNIENKRTWSPETYGLCERLSIYYKARITPVDIVFEIDEHQLYYPLRWSYLKRYYLIIEIESSNSIHRKKFSLGNSPDISYII